MNNVNTVSRYSSASNLHILQSISKSALGPYIKDVSKIFEILNPLLLCPHLVIIYSTKSTQPPTLSLLLAYPPPSPGAEDLYDWPLSCIPTKYVLLIICNLSHFGVINLSSKQTMDDMLWVELWMWGYNNISIFVIRALCLCLQFSHLNPIKLRWRVPSL